MSKQKYIDFYTKEYTKKFEFLSYLVFKDYIKQKEEEFKQDEYFERIINQLYN